MPTHDALAKFFAHLVCYAIIGAIGLFLISITPGWVLGWAFVVGAIFVAPAAFSRLP